MTITFLSNMLCHISEDLFFFLFFYSSQFISKGFTALCPDAVPACLLMEKFPSESLYGIFL